MGWLTFWGRCVQRAAVGSLNGALNWGPVVGLAVIGFVANWQGVIVSFPDTIPGSITGVLACAGAAWVIIFFVRLVAVAPYQLWKESGDNSQRLLKELEQIKIEAEALRRAALDKIAHALVITGSVESNAESSNGEPLEWQIHVANTSEIPLEYQSMKITAQPDGGAPECRLTAKKVLQRGAPAVYKFPFEGKYEPRTGELMIDASVDYGLVGKPASRRLLQKLRVPFKPRGIVTFSDSFNIERNETTI